MSTPYKVPPGVWTLFKGCLKRINGDGNLVSQCAACSVGGANFVQADADYSKSRVEFSRILSVQRGADGWPARVDLLKTIWLVDLLRHGTQKSNDMP